MSSHIQTIDCNPKYEVTDISMSSTPSPSNRMQNLMACQSFPPNIKRRIKALKKLMFEKLKIDGELQREVFDLQIKYDPKYTPILQKRRDIISGKHEPNDKECDFNSDEELSNHLKQKLNLKDKKQVNGIPGFWLSAMKVDEELDDWIEPHDEPVLNYLVDIQVIRSANPPKLTLKFFFDPNDYFTNKELTKEYEIGFGPDPKNPWELEECLCLNRKGCSIDWKPDKNVTQKTRRIKIAKKANEASSTQIETLNSFFDFFTTPKVPEKSEKMTKEIEEQLSDDWKLGKLLCQSFVSNAVLYLTGDVFDDDSSTEERNTSATGSASSATSSSGPNGSSRSSSSNGSSGKSPVKK